MPHVEAHLMKDKLQKLSLIIVLDENESVLAAIKAAMAQNNVLSAKVTDINGKLKEGLIYFTEGSKLKSKKLVDREVFRASGTFNLSYNELFGRMNVTAKDPRPITGTLSHGIAREGLEIKMVFFK